MMDGRHIGILLPIFILNYSVCVNYPHVVVHPPAKFRRNQRLMLLLQQLLLLLMMMMTK